MSERCYIHTFVLLVTLTVGCIIWTIITVVSIQAEQHAMVFIATGCTCTSLLLLLMRFLCYVQGHSTVVVPMESWSLVRVVMPKSPIRRMVVELDEAARHLHLADSQTSPHVVVTFPHAFDDEPPDVCDTSRKKHGSHGDEND